MTADLQILDRAAAGATPRAIEDAIATAFAIRHVNELRYCHDWGAWLRWDGSRWERERRRLAFHYAREIAREANQEHKAAAAKASTAAGVERFAQADPRLSTIADDWDQDPWLLATPGGTVDLRTGELRAAKRHDHITKRTAVTPAGDPDLWLRFLDETTKGDTALAAYLQRVAGYCLTGDISEHALFFVHGPGGNGKGVFTGALCAILGDLAKVADMATFTAAKGERHTTDLAMLRGARLVTAEETEKGHAWAETRIKALTGGGKITARFMRQDNFTFDPTFKLLIVGNHKPVLKTVDDAARRRFHIIPFKNKPTRDRELPERLKAEWPAILAWAIEGCLEWQAEGLQPPETVLAATEDYFAEQDVFGRWLEDCCTEEAHAWELTARLYCSWSDYARQCGEEPGSTRAFNGTLSGLGFTAGREYVHGATQRLFRGLRLRL